MRLETFNAFMNMALDEAILRARIDNVVPDTMRLYRWRPSAVSIGRFQTIETQVHLENCRRHGVDIVRRVSGGGTVFHDTNDEITYCIVADKRTLATQEIAAVYRKICAGLSNALNILGLRSDFDKGNVKSCPNLVVTGKKISGSAQCHRRGVVLQHGTLLLDVDLEEMFTFLRVTWAADSKIILDTAKRRITSIKKEYGRDVSINEVEKALIKGFQEALEMKLVEGELTTYEERLCERLCREKYTRDEWNFSVQSNYW